MKKIKGLFKGKGAENSPSTSKTAGVVQKNAYDVKEKDLPKLHKAAWNGDLNKVKSLAKKDVNSLDKENRLANYFDIHQSIIDTLRKKFGILQVAFFFFVKMGMLNKMKFQIPESNMIKLELIRSIPNIHLFYSVSIRLF